MTYPLISEYVEAVRNAEDNFDKLRNLRLVTDGNGNPVMTSGNFAVVFKMRDEKNDKLYAVKCFHKDQPNRAENYRMIAEELEFVSSSFLTKFQYLDNELFVDSANADGEEFPVLLMDWVEGINLGQYVHAHCSNKYELGVLAYQFSKLAMWIMPQPFAHGDIKPDNILVHGDGSIVLIDYDGMYVPAMKGQKASEIGSPDYRHPSRTANDFDKHIDDLSLVSILLSLRALANEPSLLEAFGNDDGMLFSEKDYRNIRRCPVLKEIFPSEESEINTLVSLFTLSLNNGKIPSGLSTMLYIQKPNERHTKEKTIDVSEKLEHVWIGPYGAIYSNDKKVLLSVPSDVENCSIIEGTESIGPHAFSKVDDVEWEIFSTDPDYYMNAWHSNLRHLKLPKSLKEIDKDAFEGCYKLISANIPSHIRIEDNMEVFNRFFSHLHNLQIDNEDYIKDGTIIYNKERTTLFACLPSQYKKVNIDAYWSILDFARIHGSFINVTVKVLDTSDRYVCRFVNKKTGNSKDVRLWGDFENITAEEIYSKKQDLAVVHIHDFYVNDYFLDWKKNVITEPDKSQHLPHGLKKIAKGAFANNQILEEIYLPSTLEIVDDTSFEKCFNLKKIYVPDDNIEKIERQLPLHKQIIELDLPF